MRKVINNRADTLISLASFCAFAAAMLLVLLFGAGIYKNIVEKSNEGYEERICLSYIWTKIKTNDTAGRIYVGEFCGLPALYLEEEYEFTTYTTAIYLYDGWVRELFCETGLEFNPEDGMPVIEVDALDFEQVGDGLVCAKVNSERMYISPRCSGRTAFYDIEG